MLLPSIHDDVAIDLAAVAARQGFAYQDEVAAYYLLLMVVQADLLEVRCEGEDDITLVWSVGDEHAVEYMQVKSEDRPSPWSVDAICQQPAGEGSSILERSVDRDRVREEPRFAFVTRAGVGPGLRVLRGERSAPPSPPEVRDLEDLPGALNERRNVRSPHCANAGSWAVRTRWIEGGTLQDWEQWNRALLGSIREAQILLVDQRESLLNEVRRLALAAARSRTRQQKAVQRGRFLTWFGQRVALANAAVQGGDTLEAKLVAALVPEEATAAKELRRHYVRASRGPAPYMSLGQKDRLYEEVVARLAVLRARHAGLDGRAFFRKCVDELSSPQEEVGPRLGAMYFAAGRCLHWFQVAL